QSAEWLSFSSSLPLCDRALPNDNAGMARGGTIAFRALPSRGGAGVAWRRESQRSGPRTRSVRMLNAFLNRRRFLLGAGALGLGGTTLLLTACSDRNSSEASRAEEGTSLRD